MSVPFRRAACVVSLLGCGELGGNGPAASPSGESAGTGSAAIEESPPAGPPHDVDCGDFTTCAVSTDGLARCWGSDKGGELGDGAGAGEKLRRTVVPGVGPARKIALASQFACALLEDKRVKCWGSGKIANDGKAVMASRATSVAGVEDVDELVGSGTIVCARGGRGVACWGAETSTIGTPPASPMTQISAGFNHACGLDPKGAVICWGQGEWNTTGGFGKPPISGARSVVTGDRHSCVVTKDRTVQCWGMNDAGQLGAKPDVVPHKKPIAVAGLTNVAKLAAGEASTCAILEDRSVRCWGSNGEGELGLGTRSSDERPRRVPALADVEHICLATQHGCALTKQGRLLCWGANAFGQLGDGTKERRPAPTSVAW